MIDGIQLDSDTERHKLSEFKYRDFTHEMIKRVTKAGVKAKREFEWVLSSALITAKGVMKAGHLPVTVRDKEGWKKAEEFVRD